MAKKAGMSTGVEVARISVKVSPDTKAFRRELKQDLEEIERTLKAKIDVEPDMDGFRKKVEAGTKGLKTKVKVKTDVDPEVDRKTYFGKLGDVLSNIKAPSFGSGINPAGYAVILAGILAVAAPLMGIITSALLAIPGLLSLVATPIAAVTLGLEGMGNAVNVLAEPFKQLQSVMNSANESAFAPVFERLGAIFPTLERSLPAVSQGLADMAGSIVDVLTSEEGMGMIDRTIANVAQALSDAGPGMGDFTSGILKLAEGLSNTFPGLTDWFNGAGKSFNDWISSMSDGQLEEIFRGLGDTLKVVLDALGGMATQGIEFMKDPQKVADFANGLKSVGDSLVKIVELSDKLNNGNLFSSIMPEGFQLDGGFDFSSVLESLKEPFTSENAPWRDMWAGFQENSAQVWGTVVATVQGAINNVIGAVQSVGATISSIWNGIADTAAAAWNGVVSAVQSAWETIKSAVQTGIDAVISFVSDMGGRIISAVTSIDLSGAGRALMEGLLGGIKAGAEAVYNFVAGIAGKIASLKGPIEYDKKVLIPNGQALMQGLGVGMENGFAPVLDQAKGMAGQIADAFASGADPTTFLNGFTKKEVSRMEKVLGLEIAKLDAQADALKLQAKLSKDEGLKARAQAIEDMKSELSLQKKMLDVAGDYNDELSSAGDAAGEDPFAKAAAGLAATPVNFAKATGKQFLSDIGIGGDGIISRALTEGIQYIFNISSVDEAMSIKDRETNKSAIAGMGGAR